MKRAALVLLLAVPPVHAATVEVRVQDEQGTAMPARTVQLSSESERMERARFERTGESGTATFAHLKPGTYRLAALPSAGFVVPGSNPLDPPKVVTLIRDDDHVSVLLQLRRGVRFVARMQAARSGALAGSLTLMGERTGSTASAALEDGRYTELTLLPDRWQVRFQPPAGWTTVGVERNGDDWREATMELSPDAGDTFLDWEIAAAGSIEGRVVANQPPLVGLSLELLGPGPWAQAQQAAGRDVPRLVQAHTDEHGDWGVLLPDGTWRVQPAPDDVSGATVHPGSVIVDVPSGGSARADFEITFPEREGDEAGLIVAVEDPEGNSIAGEVAVFRAGTREAVARTRAAPFARVSLEAGSYTVEATHPAYLAGTVELPDFEPAPEPRHVKVRLRQGARVRVRAADAKGVPAEGVRVALAEQGDAGDRSGATDASGWVTFTGLPGGTYTLTADEDRAGKARFAWEESPVVELDDREEAVRHLRVLPAATLIARLVCEGGEALPPKVRVRVLPDPASDPLLETDVLLQPGGLLEAGPLGAGNVHVAVLPAEFDRETWALGTETPGESAQVQIEDAGATDLGTIQIHCGPRASLRLSDRSPPVDLSRGPARVEGAMVGDRRVPLRTLSLARSRDSIEVSGLPAGMVELVVTLCSPDAPPASPGEEACSPAEGQRVRPVQWTVPVPAVLGKIHETNVDWPWPGGSRREP
ncbi:MAG TPA: carboxypeptidase-like regulatory domain-containing protein [Candidatus Polarisedimenticolaceae bacterium]|nr:carboxypeptidase-like regulatory domain-containing protein [Candidatus Polarisedimenticolaceae bacterium]